MRWIIYHYSYLHYLTVFIKNKNIYLHYLTTVIYIIYHYMALFE